MFLHMSIILSTGVCLPQCMLGYTPRADTPRADTPPQQTATAADLLECILVKGLLFDSLKRKWHFLFNNNSKFEYNTSNQRHQI